MNIAQIKAAIHDWVVENTDFVADDTARAKRIVFANQNAPRPSTPFITILVASLPISEHSEVKAPAADGNADIANHRMVTASIQCYGDNALGIMEGLILSLQKVTVQQSLRAAGLPYIRTLSDVDDRSDVVGTKFEGRAGADLEFRAVATVTDAVGVIESVEGTATHETGENTNYENDFQIGA